jgi:integrase
VVPQAARQGLAHWLGIKRPEVEPATLVFYERRVRLHLLPRLGSVPLAELRPLHVRELLAGMTADGRSAGERHKAWKTLRSALEEAIRLEQIGRNPAKAVKLSKVDRRELRCLDAEQVQRFLRPAQPDRLAAYYVVAIDAGLRPGGSLRPALAVRGLAGGVGGRRMERGKPGGTLPPQATQDGRRRILLVPQTMAALAGHRERMRAEGWDTARGWVFRNTTGGFLQLSDVRRLSFLPILKSADLPPVRLYDLRHSSATLLLAADVNVKAVSKRLGHERIDITLRHYAHVVPRMQQRAVQAMTGILGDYPTGIPPEARMDGDNRTQSQDE